MEDYNLTFSGSGLLFPVHIGAYRELLERNNAKMPSELSGTSGGSIVAAMLALGKPLADLITIAEETRLSDYLEYNPLAILNFGFCNGKKFEHMLKSHLGETTLGDTEIPLHIAASDTVTGKGMVFSSKTHPTMPIWKAVRASCTIPFLLAPLKYRGHKLVDGAIHNNMPTNVFNEDRKTIGVHIRATMTNNTLVKDQRHIFGYALSIFNGLFTTLTDMQVDIDAEKDHVDLYHIDLTEYAYLDEYPFEHLLELGEKTIKAGIFH